MTVPTLDDSPLRVELFDDFEPLRDVWNGLAVRADSVFSTIEWASTWWRNFGSGRPLALILLRDEDGGPVAILPLYLASCRPLRVLRFVGRGPADELGPVCDPQDRRRVAAALRGALQELDFGWDVLVAENLPQDAAWESFGAVARLSTISNPAIDFGGAGWEEYLATRGRKFRQQMRRNEKRLTADHGLNYRLCDDLEHLERDLDTLFELHRARWGEESSGVFEGAEAQFQREFAKVALERGWLRLWVLELEGEPVAAKLGFQFEDVGYGYQAGRSMGWEKFGIGFLLQVHVIREAVGEGAREFRLLRGGEAYKDRFANTPGSLESIAVPNGVRGRAAVAANGLASALPAGARRWYSRLAGAR